MGHAVTSDHSSSYLDKKGVLSWLRTVDHKRIGIMYLFSVLFFLMVGGIFALLIRLELMTPGQTIVGPAAYNKLFTYHGTIMVFLVIIPSIPAALGNFFLPIQIGAKDVAFPKLNLASFYIYLIGGSMAVYAIFFGGFDAGWTFYAPYSFTRGGGGVPMVALGAFTVGFSSILTGLNFIVTVHQLRAPGMTWHRMPLFIWALYATAILQVLATPVIGITLVLVMMEKLLGIGFFDPALGGDPVLFQHFFWFYSHPAVYIMIVPAFGVISEIITVFSRKKIFGYDAIAYSSLAIAFISFLVWGHHMFVTGQSPLVNQIFSVLTMFVAIPTAIKVFNWTATLYKGSILMKTPMLYVLYFLFVFTIGGLTGLFLAAISLDVHFHDTYFVVAHFHYVMVGGTILSFLGGIHYWWPKMFGRMYPEKWGKISSTLIFIGFNVTFLVQFKLGAEGMPRRYYDYLPQYATLNAVSTFGSWILGAGFLIMFVYLIRSLFVGEKASINPWDGQTLEWQIESPPTEHNFHHIPTVTEGPYEYGLKKVEH